MRASQAHLNTDRAQSELLQSLNAVLGEECHLSVEIGDGGETPLELRERLYQSKLKDAFSSLENDANVQFIERRFAAELDRDMPVQYNAPPMQCSTRIETSSSFSDGHIILGKQIRELNSWG